MSFNELIEGALTVSERVRNEPVQARSSERISALLDAASAVVSEVGIERLTTAMVADRAGASIGTVYRYFPDRIAVLAAMSLRGYERFVRTAVDNLEQSAPETWQDAVDRVIDASVHLHRTEPGYTSLRLSDQVALPDVDGVSMITARFAAPFAKVLVSEYSLTDDGSLADRLDTALTAVDALLVRAFLRDRAGDERAIEAARSVARSVLAAEDSPLVA
ncbi:TetR family transcriptional regulator [Cnuibacter physcomitrellae]|uniref:TetR/AcrR family transcriptional regulator n=1 Tax=Cnuibacter physcomitrellae TaxID=1619308 RepID=UPI00217574A4|nr:TetR/AcrR family transcriptional regulator [Cnuibacter physcomitrellae]MCS5499136.1 TetR family transcriptional regulator [Cnuibacter physcomitrellae]